MKEAPLVSVIVPAYDVASFIGDALRSMQDQTLQEWECLVVDDASTDGTAAIAQAFANADPRFRVIREEVNAGVSAARNRALSEVRGRYVQMLDADDVIAPRKLEIHVDLLERTPDVALVYSDFHHFTERHDFAAKGEYAADEKFTGTNEDVVARLLRGNTFRLNTVLVRTAVLRDLGGFREAFRSVEDWDLWLRLAASGHTIRFLDDPRCMAGVRVNPKGLSKDLPGMRRFHLPVLQHLWATQRLSTRHTWLLLMRYVDFLFEATIVHRTEWILIDERRSAFLLRVVPLAVLLFPVWVLSRPLRAWR